MLSSTSFARRLLSALEAPSLCPAVPSPPPKTLCARSAAIRGSDRSNVLTAAHAAAGQAGRNDAPGCSAQRRRPKAEGRPRAPKIYRSKLCRLRGFAFVGLRTVQKRYATLLLIECSNATYQNSCTCCTASKTGNIDHCKIYRHYLIKFTSKTWGNF